MKENGIGEHAKSLSSVPKNSIMVIHTYKHKGMWVFDDNSVGLVKEPFVAGADTLLDYISENFLAGSPDVLIIFGDVPFPPSQIRLVKVNKDVTGEGGTDYFCPELNHDVWLCPALLKYFAVAPQTIWAQFKKTE